MQPVLMLTIRHNNIMCLNLIILQVGLCLATGIVVLTGMWC